MFKKILIANRGEIACRVMRTARQMGLRTVAVFSDADVLSAHVKRADEAVRIGPAPASQSYLSIAALIDAARRTRADAVHPGYGFLSERADFAQACADAGLVFIGPPPAAIRAMGDKAQAKRRMVQAGVPCVPGYLGEEQSEPRLAHEARALGFPLLVKAVAGGGGRGMRLVQREEELDAALAGARREAQNAFGDGALMLERLIENARHIEIQVFADSHGHVVHLGERDCTAQRRRQKVIEEAPSPAVGPALREAMGRDAVAAARAVGYVGAGTVEFIVDAKGGHFFLEMNTRLQVEHPVTEAITGLDLVEWQFQVAGGQALPLAQNQIRFDGHAIEARLYAEDPYDGFKPQTGRVVHWRPDAARALDVRVDDGLIEGGEVGPHYDTLVAKLIAHGPNRDDAIRRLAAALDATPLLGVRNNGRFLRDLILSADFRGSTLTTATIDQWAVTAAPWLQRPRPDDDLWLVAAAARALREGAGYRPAGIAAFDLTLQCEGEERAMRVHPADGAVRIGQGGAVRELRMLARDPGDDRLLGFEIDGRFNKLLVHDDGQTLYLAHQGAQFAFSEPSPWPRRSDCADPCRARAPVAGVVAQVLVRAGDAVAQGQPLLSVEAMKMEMWLTAAAAGTVRAVHAAPMAAVESGAVLVELDISE